jgi:hypothetical protein
MQLFRGDGPRDRLPQNRCSCNEAGDERLEGSRDPLEQDAKALLARETLSVTDLEDLISSSAMETPLREDAIAAQ